MPKGTFSVEIIWQPGERAPLHKILYWSAKLSADAGWVLILSIRDFLKRIPEGNFMAEMADQEHAVIELAHERAAELAALPCAAPSGEQPKDIPPTS